LGRGKNTSCGGWQHDILDLACRAAVVVAAAAVARQGQRQLALAATDLVPAAAA